jgi:hypothetical protein
MCLNPADDARMCIHCSAIVCAKCIEVFVVIICNYFCMIFFLFIRVGLIEGIPVRNVRKYFLSIELPFIFI